jgi:hypothetical protein
MILIITHNDPISQKIQLSSMMLLRNSLCVSQRVKDFDSLPSKAILFPSYQVIIKFFRRYDTIILNCYYKRKFSKVILNLLSIFMMSPVKISCYDIDQFEFVSAKDILKKLLQKMILVKGKFKFIRYLLTQNI